MERPPNPFEQGPERDKEKGVATCPTCGGSGEVTENGKTVKCKRCNGSGQIRVS